MTTGLISPDARRRLTASRTELVLNPDSVFFGTLVLKLKLVEDPSAPTAWTDGQSIGYSPKFIMSLKGPEITALLVHEVMHCAAGHPWRRDGREPKKFNQACDRAINPVLRDAGYTLPPDGLFELEPSHKGKSAEWIYDRLPSAEEGNQSSSGAGAGGQSGQSGNQPQGNQPQQGPNNKGGTQGKRPAPGQQTPKPPSHAPKGQQSPTGPSQDTGTHPNNHKSDSKPNSLGEVRDAPTEVAYPDDTLQTEADWQQSVQQAAVLAKGQGNMPGELKRFAKVAATSRIDWRSALRRFVQEVARADYSFSRPNVRYVARGLYLPTLRSHEVGVIAVGVDTSGSIDQVLLDQFAGEIKAIAEEVKPRQIRVLYADAAIQHEDIFERDDDIVLRPKGGGGTDFRPVFDAIETWDEPPVAVIYLTDLYGTFPQEEPNTPTLWVTGNERPRPVPFGEVVTAA